ncbi:hypothetical protein OVY01_22320 [Robbsia sp. Bb-Pol-6]|uniref:DUF6933 domain-containing protein n=1 Tax=Robbsia betulipollinis TaxID=2981849 RepID=A0ABT3ZTI6_9BURK|nr:hypothetical protein [Robbsia betulipollinis]MCY0389878.1 hypothetical protein [Robbsia betulipollinis]
MLRFYCTKKLLDRIGERPATEVSGISGKNLSNWYTTILFLKPQIALLVNECTLLPLLMPLAPEKTLATRFPAHLAEILSLHGWRPDRIESELRQLDGHQFLKTANRSVLGIMNEFAFSAEVYKHHHRSDDTQRIALALAEIVFKPIQYQSPSQLLAVIEAHGSNLH